MRMHAPGTRAAISNAASQGISCLVGSSRSFSWHQVVASAAGAAAGSFVRDIGGEMIDGGRPPSFAVRSLSATAAGFAAAAARGGRVVVQQVATDAFGNHLGNELGELAGGPVGKLVKQAWLRSHEEDARLRAFNAMIAAESEVMTIQELAAGADAQLSTPPRAVEDEAERAALIAQLGEDGYEAGEVDLELPDISTRTAYNDPQLVQSGPGGPMVLDAGGVEGVRPTDPADSDLKWLGRSLLNREHWSQTLQLVSGIGKGAFDFPTQFAMTLVKGFMVGGAGLTAAEGGADPLLAMNEARKAADEMWDGKIFPRTSIYEQLGSPIGEAWSPLAWGGALRLGQLGIGLLRDPLIVEGAASRLVPGGGLAAHEGLGTPPGHLLLKHVGQSEAALSARLAAEPHIKAASTFVTRAEAEAGVSAVLDARAAQVAGWEASGASGQLVLRAPFSGGIVLPRGASATMPGTNVQVILRGTGGGRWRIHTGYPTP